jgi:hypothetical protein
MISSAAKGLGLSLLILAAAACGGDKPPPPVTPDTSSSTSDGGADMPSTTTTATGDAGAPDTTATTPPPAAPSKLDLPAASAKMKFKGTDLELKSDGTVNTKGKMSGKVQGMELDDKDGKATLKVDGDGNITAGDGSAYAKFNGDDLAAMNGATWTLGDDGLSQTDEKGKKSNLGKADGVGTAKKAFLLVVAWQAWGAKAPKAPAAKGDKPAGKPVTGTKPKP